MSTSKGGEVLHSDNYLAVSADYLEASSSANVGNRSDIIRENLCKFHWTVGMAKKSRNPYMITSTYFMPDKKGIWKTSPTQIQVTRCWIDEWRHCVAINKLRLWSFRPFSSQFETSIHVTGILNENSRRPGRGKKESKRNHNRIEQNAYQKNSLRRCPLVSSCFDNLWW